MDRIGKIFKVEQGMRRCCVCDELFTRDGAQEHFEAPCHPNAEAARATAAGQSR